MGIVSMMNDLRATGAEPEMLKYTTKYWERFSDSIEAIRTIINRFNSRVLVKLQLMFSNQLVVPSTETELAKSYHQDMSAYIDRMRKLSTKLEALIVSYRNNVDR